jgi:hypothetical protein
VSHILLNSCWDNRRCYTLWSTHTVQIYNQKNAEIQKCQLQHLTWSGWTNSITSGSVVLFVMLSTSGAIHIWQNRLWVWLGRALQHSIIVCTHIIYPQSWGTATQRQHFFTISSSLLLDWHTNQLSGLFMSLTDYCHIQNIVRHKTERCQAVLMHACKK